MGRDTCLNHCPPKGFPPQRRGAAPQHLEMAAGGRHFPLLRPPRPARPGTARLGGGAAAAALVPAPQGAGGEAGSGKSLLRLGSAGRLPRPQPPPAAAAVPAGPVAPMAAEPQPKALTRKPLLLNKVEGSQEVVNMAAIVPKEDGVISVSEDRYRGGDVHRSCGAVACRVPHHLPVMVVDQGPGPSLLASPTSAGGT